MNPREVDRGDLLLPVPTVGRDRCGFIFCCVLSEEMVGYNSDEREEFAFRIREGFRFVPGLDRFSRIGMYDFLGQTIEERTLVLAWARCHLQDQAAPSIRWGLAFGSELGPAHIEALLIGTSEAARTFPNHFVFELGRDNWVRPI